METKPHAIVLQKTVHVPQQPRERYIPDHFNTDHKSCEQSKNRSVFLTVYVTERVTRLHKYNVPWLFQNNPTSERMNVDQQDNWINTYKGMQMRRNPVDSPNSDILNFTLSVCVFV